MGCGSLSTLRASRHPPAPAPNADAHYDIPLPASLPVPAFPTLEGYEDYGSEVALEENAWRPYYERQASAMTPLRYSMHGYNVPAAKDGVRGRKKEKKEDPVVVEVVGEKSDGV